MASMLDTSFIRSPLDGAVLTMPPSVCWWLKSWLTKWSWLLYADCPLALPASGVAIICWLVNVSWPGQGYDGNWDSDPMTSSMSSLFVPCNPVWPNASPLKLDISSWRDWTMLSNSGGTLAYDGSCFEWPRVDPWDFSFGVFLAFGLTRSDGCSPFICR